MTKGAPPPPSGATEADGASADQEPSRWLGLPRRRRRSLSDAVRQRLVETVYLQPGMMIAGLVCMVSVAGIEWSRTGDRR